MRIIRSILCTTALMVQFQFCFGQVDSVVLTLSEYLENVIRYHPLSQKADLNIRLAAAELVGARGTLDPIIQADWNQKNFDDQLYYQNYRAKMVIPTRLGIDLVGGYENTEGVFLNPENKTDEFGLWQLGLEANVLQGLFVNERQTALELADVFQELAVNERQLSLNKLIYSASLAYLFWQQYVSYNEILLENATLADRYFQNTKQSFFNGEQTAMDTLEANIIYQDAIASIQKNNVALIKARQTVENFLWFNNVPVALQPRIVPENYQNSMFNLSAVVLDSFNLSNHPELQRAISELDYLEVEQRLKREKLKPKLKIKFNPLAQTAENSIRPSLSISNVQWGFDFSMPLLWRTERLDVERGEIKILESQLELENTRNNLLNAVEGSLQRRLVLDDQVALLTANVTNYRRLLDGENEKFRFGESSVFLVNRRQEKYINGQLKLIETYVNRQIELLNYLYYSNQLLNQ